MTTAAPLPQESPESPESPGPPEPPSPTGSPDPPESSRRLFGLEWPTRVEPRQQRVLVAGGLGWLLDAMDVSLYTLVLVHLQRDFGMDNATAGRLQTLTLVASAVGGALFGVLADRFGRARALMASILVYSLASGASAFTTTIAALSVCRIVLGLGMGGEWSTGAALIAETWPARHRAKALGLMQSTYAIGEMVAALVVALVLPRFGWRAVFLVGVLPAFFVLWIRRKVREPEAWTASVNQSAGAGRSAWRELLTTPHLRRRALLATAMNACAMFAYWGLFTWIPKFLNAPVEEGGRNLTLNKTVAWLVLIGVGKFLGYALFGFLSDRFGRRRCYVVYLVAAALVVPLFATCTSSWQLLALAPLVAFFGTGFFSGYSALATELFPTPIRATAMGFTYNVGRGLSAVAPWMVGAVVDATNSFTGGFIALAGAYLVAGLLAAALPDASAR